MASILGIRSVILICAAFGTSSVFAQSLPAPSRTVFKCTVHGKVTYADDPCVGAKRIEIEPTRGLNKATGRELSGTDVSREKHREQIAEALKPLTGLTPKQFDVQRRRINLAPQVRSECARLDANISQAEARERAEPVETRPAVQRHVFSLRKRHRDLRC